MRLRKQRVLLLRLGGRLFFLLFDSQPFNDRLLAFGLISPLELEIESRQQDVRLHVIGQYLDDLLEQFDGLFSLPLSLNQLRQMKKRARVFGSKFQRVTEQEIGRASCRERV